MICHMIYKSQNYLERERGTEVERGRSNIEKKFDLRIQTGPINEASGVYFDGFLENLSYNFFGMTPIR